MPVPSVFASEHEARPELLEQSPKVSPLTMRISRGGTYCLVPKGPPSSLGGRVRQAGTLSPERNDTGVARRSYQRCDPDPKQYKGLCFSQHRHVSACYICFCAVAFGFWSPIRALKTCFICLCSRACWRCPLSRLDRTCSVHGTSCILARLWALKWPQDLLMLIALHPCTICYSCETDQALTL